MKLSTKLSWAFGLIIVVIIVIFIGNYTASSAVKEMFTSYEEIINPSIETTHKYISTNIELSLNLNNLSDNNVNWDAKNRVLAILDIEIPYLNNRLFQIIETDYADSLTTINIKQIIANSIVLENRARSILRLQSKPKARKKKLKEYHSDFKTFSDKNKLLLNQLLIHFNENKIKSHQSLKEMINRNNRFSLTFGAFAIVASIFIAVIIIRQLNRRFLYLKQASQKVKEGDLDTPINTAGKDEINELSEFLNNMRKGLKTNFNLLREQQNEIQKSATILKQQAKSLEQSNYIATHDLKAPINTLKGYLIHFKSKGFVDPKGQPMIDMMEKTIHQVMETIENLHDVAKLKGSIHNAEIVSVSFEETLEGVLTMINNSITTSKAIIEYNFENVPTIEYSKTHLTSIVQNLITNAIKYTNDGMSPKIQIRTYVEDGFITFEIKDNGIGIDLEKYQSRLFGLFQRFNNKYPGKGIGLHVIHSIIESYGGRIDVESKLDKGTTFKCRLKKD